MTNIAKIVELVKTFPDIRLTGSYAFGTAKANSDVDFFLEYSESAIDLLLRLGYKSVTMTDYNDTLTECVYAGYGIHIQLVKDVILKESAQAYLLTLPAAFSEAMRTASKPVRCEIWNWAITLAGKYLM